MAVKIRLKRFGKIRSPFYRIVVADSRTKRDGRVIEEIGKYDPTQNPSFIEVQSERALYWLGVGAQPTEQVAAILKLTGDWAKHTGVGDTESRVQQPEAKQAFEADTAKKPVLRPKSEKPAEASPEEASESAADSTEPAAAEETPAAEAESSEN